MEGLTRRRNVKKGRNASHGRALVLASQASFRWWNEIIRCQFSISRLDISRSCEKSGSTISCALCERMEGESLRIPRKTPPTSKDHHDSSLSLHRHKKYWDKIVFLGSFVIISRWSTCYGSTEAWKWTCASSLWRRVRWKISVSPALTVRKFTSRSKHDACQHW